MLPVSYTHLDVYKRQVGLAWFSAVYLENAYRALIFPAVLIGIATQGTLLQVAKYGLCMVIVVVLTNLLENGGERVGKWAVGFFAGAGKMCIRDSPGTGQLHQRYRRSGQGCGNCL